jgi:hypothetical protein
MTKTFGNWASFTHYTGGDLASWQGNVADLL